MSNRSSRGIETLRINDNVYIQWKSVCARERARLFVAWHHHSVRVCERGISSSNNKRWWQQSPRIIRIMWTKSQDILLFFLFFPADVARQHTSCVCFSLLTNFSHVICPVSQSFISCTGSFWKLARAGGILLLLPGNVAKHTHIY